MSSKDPQRIARKRNLFQLIDSYVHEKIDIALVLMEGDRGLHQALKKRYYPLMRLIDPKLGGGFQLLHRIADSLAGEPDDEFLRAMIAHYALLGEREIVASIMLKHPAAVNFVNSPQLLSMLTAMTLSPDTTVSGISLETDGPLQLSPGWAGWARCLLLHCTVPAHLQALSPYLCEMTQLSKLEITGCALSYWNLQMPPTDRLLICDLRQNRFTSIPSPLRDARKLKWLSMNHNYLRALPPWLPELSAIKLLQLDGNEITELPEAILTMPQLNTLSLAGNKLTSFPELQSPASRALTSLMLSHNPLDHYPPALTMLPGLTHLGLNGCNISNLPDEIASLNELTYLSLHQNPLSRLPEAIGDLTKLEILDLRGCPLLSLPESIGNLTALQELDLRNTRILNLPESIQQLQQLKTLRIHHPNAEISKAIMDTLRLWLPNCIISSS